MIEAADGSDALPSVISSTTSILNPCHVAPRLLFKAPHLYTLRGETWKETQEMTRHMPLTRPLPSSHLAKTTGKRTAAVVQVIQWTEYIAI